jgi:MSHA biogenesis protein MshP
VIAIFVIVVMALLGLAMTRILSAASDAIVYEVYGLRALQAARSGIEQKIVEVFPLSEDEESDCATELNSKLNFPNLPGFENCTYTTTCEATAIGVDGAEGIYYRFKSTGKCQIGGITVNRVVSVDAKQ